ncbi:MAG: hypothetical protein ABSB74_06730 [Tepidisphaeraceae bacterium]
MVRRLQFNPMIDPFTQTSQAILGSLQADAGWASMVKPGNVVDMTADSFERFKLQLQLADVPEVILLQGGFKLKPFGASSRMTEMDQSYQLIATHDSLRVRPVNQLKFQTLIALARAGPSLGLEGLIRDWEITQGEDDAVGQKQWRRGTQRWVSVLSIRVSMYLARERLVSLC